MAMDGYLTNGVSGSIGNQTYRVIGGRQVISERIRHANNPKTIPQMMQRVKFPNLVSTYKAAHGLLRGYFEKHNLLKDNRGGFDFNRFVSLNLQNYPVYLSRLESAGGYCIAAPYQISDGSLPAIETMGTGRETCTNIHLDGLTIDSDTTVSAFAKAVVENNALYEYGDAIVFFRFLQRKREETGIPYLAVERYRVMLDAADQSLLREHAPAVGFSLRDGMLGHGEELDQEAFAWVHTRRGWEKEFVSPQRLIVCCRLFGEYNSEEAKIRALESYGATCIALEPVSIK